MKIAVIGQGYVGRSLTTSIASVDLNCIGLDINLEKVIKSINEDSVSDSLDNSKFRDFVIQGKIVLTDSYEDISNCDVVIIAVPTPLDSARKPDLTALDLVCRELNVIFDKPILIINESTSYPGTLRNFIAPKFTKVKHLFASSPERIDPGNDFWTNKNTPRLISGLTTEATAKARKVYEMFCDSLIVVSTPEVAEAAKLFENTFRQVNIALVNEFAQISEKFGFSATEAIEAAATKPFGFMPFRPGIGVGGHCIPVDPSYLSFAVEELGGKAGFIDLANKINLHMPEYLSKRINKELDGLPGKVIQIAGIAYKPGVSDIRESPALLLISELRKFGAEVIWHDPMVKEWSGEKSVDLSSQIDLGLIVTPHAIIDFNPWKNGVKVFDLSATSKDFGWAKYL